jgi:2-polyprenyl-6-methoxyphenol hydroxylase-like FAD-dependent oxidoreductase
MSYVVGSGIIGMGLANSLSRQDVSVVLVDPAAGQETSAGIAGLVTPVTLES